MSVDKIIHIICPRCKGDGTFLKPSGGTLIHTICSVCGGDGAADVPESILKMFIENKNLGRNHENRKAQ